MSELKLKGDEKMSNEEKLAMYIANCQCCLLAEKMKNCPLCRFNIGLEKKKEEEIKNVS